MDASGIKTKEMLDMAQSTSTGDFVIAISVRINIILNERKLSPVLVPGGRPGEVHRSVHHNSAALSRVYDSCKNRVEYKSAEKDPDEITRSLNLLKTQWQKNRSMRRGANRLEKEMHAEPANRKGQRALLWRSNQN